MSEDVQRPDAVLIPTSWKNEMPPGAPVPAGIPMHAHHRCTAMVLHAERLLGTDYDGGQRAHVRLADGQYHFCSHSPHDPLFFPKNHARSGRPLYRWTRQQDGSVHGRFVDDAARSAAEAAARPDDQISYGQHMGVPIAMAVSS